jgi:hypothetical protein
MTPTDPTAGWAETAEPLSMVVVCNRERHRLRWEAGRVEPVDHPDLDAELALVAFGGEEPACIALHRLWHDAVADGGFVAEWADPAHLSPAWLSWLGMALERMRGEGFHEFLRHLPPARAQRMGEFLHRFSGPWIDRAGAEVNRLALAEPNLADEHRVALAQATAHRLRRAFVDAVGGRQLAVGGAALLPLQLEVEIGIEPAIGGVLRGPDRGISLMVDRSWLHQVWAAGAAVVDGRLVLAIEPAGPSGPTTARPARVVEWSAGPEPRPRLVTAAVANRDRTWIIADRAHG